VDIIKIFRRYIKGKKLVFSFVLIILLILNYLRTLAPLLIGKVFGILNNISTSTLPFFINNFINSFEQSSQLLTVAILIVVIALFRDFIHMFSDFMIADISEDQGYIYLTSTMRRMGVEEELEKVGAQEGDTVRLVDFEFTYHK
jgi:Obg family GTPase CgtA-like protein